MSTCVLFFHESNREQIKLGVEFSLIPGIGMAASVNDQLIEFRIS